MDRTAPAGRSMPWRLVESVALVVTLALLLLLRADLDTLPLVTAARVATAIAIITAYAVVRAAPRGLWSPSTMFFMMLVLFHIGLSAAVGFGRAPGPQLGESVELWLYRRSTIHAIWLTDLALVACALGIRVAALGTPRSLRPVDVDPHLEQIVGWVGAIFVLTSVVAWFVVLLGRGGPALLFSSYREFLEASTGTILPMTDRLCDLGLTFLAASRWSRGHAIAIGAFAFWSLFAMPLGLRSEVLFPVVAALAVLSARRRPMRTSRAVVLALALLMLVAAVRDVRQTGLAQTTAADVGANPLDGLVEMGASLRPVAEVVYWHDLGDRFDEGATYWAPIERALYHVVPSMTRVPAEQDHRLMNILVMDRVGPIGFSVIAEAYRNFAEPGVFFVLALIGFVLGRIDRWPATLPRQCAIGVILTGLIMHVRDPFVPLPTHFLFGFLLIGAMVIGARMRAERV